MGYIEAADGALTITDEATPREDLQKIADLAINRGGILRVTASQRENFTSAMSRVGWLISETDTGRLYLRTPSAPQGELIAGTGLPHFGYQRTVPYNFDPGAAAPITWDENPVQGELDGFSTPNRRTFTCVTPGVYSVSATAAAVAGGASTYCNLYIQKNGANIVAGNSFTTEVGFTSPSTAAHASIRFGAGDTLTVAIGSGVTVAGATGVNCALFVDFLHA